MRTTLFPLLLLVSCSTVPVTGRRQLRLISDDTEAKLGLEAYQDTLQKSKLVASGADLETVRRVGARIAKVSHEPGFAWEFNLIDDPKTVNAFCLPGGKVAVYTGILPLTQTEEGLAAVMGHEIAHAIAHHGAERMAQGEIVGAVGTALDAGLSKSSARTREAALAVFGVGANVGVLLPFSRKHESEADEIGLDYMARAGYDPRQAVEFWRRMAAHGGSKPPEFLSTHPSDETRIADLERLLPKALETYERRGGRR
ncbi:MAG TPA: M48 family metallopeptidase [Planctomycetota bacterium]|jgi:predicted Zn-dependent protease|nr:M48 family metallopeptidase [Planctomycetota bacterium]